jgi:hypothetical protein
MQTRQLAWLAHASRATHSVKGEGVPSGCSDGRPIEESSRWHKQRDATQKPDRTGLDMQCNTHKVLHQPKWRDRIRNVVQS